MLSWTSVQLFIIQEELSNSLAEALVCNVHDEVQQGCSKGGALHVDQQEDGGSLQQEGGHGDRGVRGGQQEGHGGWVERMEEVLE